MWSNLGILQIAPTDGWFFTNDRENDLLLMTASESQRIHIGTQPNALSAVTVTKDIVQLNRPIRSAYRDVDINGVGLSNYSVNFNNSTTSLQIHQPSANLSVIKTNTDDLRYVNMRGVVIGKTLPFTNVTGTDSNITSHDATQTSLMRLQVQQQLDLTGALVNTVDSNIAVAANLLPSVHRQWNIGSNTLAFRDLHTARTILGYDNNSSNHSVDPSTSFSFLYGTLQSLEWSFKLTNTDQTVMQVFDHATATVNGDVFYVGDIVPVAFPNTVRFEHVSSVNVVEGPLDTGTAFQINGSGGYISAYTKNVGFVAKYSALGVAQWAFQIVADAGSATASPAVGVRGVAVHPSTSDLYVVGYYQNATQLNVYDGTSTIVPKLSRAIPDATPTNPASGLFIAKFSGGAGEAVWVSLVNRTIIGSLTEAQILQRCSIAVNHFGRIYVTGTYDNSQVNLTHGLFVSSAYTFESWTTLLPLISNLQGTETAGFTLAIDGLTGRGQWRSRIDSANSEKALKVIADNDGNAIVGGESDSDSLKVTYNDTVSQAQLTASIGSSYPKVAFFIKFSANGTSVPLISRVFCNGLVTVDTDASNNIYLAGYFGTSECFVSNAKSSITSPTEGVIRIDPIGPDGNTTENNFLMAKYQPNGILEWVRTIRGMSSNSSTDMVVDRVSNKIHFSGGYAKPTTLSVNDVIQDTLTIPAGEVALFLGSLNTDGTFRTLSFAYPFNAVSSVRLKSDAFTNLYVTGNYAPSATQNAQFYDSFGAAFPVSPSALTTAAGSGVFSAKLNHRFIYRLASDLTAAEQGFVKTLHNSSEDYVHVYITSSNNYQVLATDSLRPSSTLSYVWHDQQWKRFGVAGEDVVVQYGDVYANTLQIVKGNEPDMTVASFDQEGDLTCRAATLTRGRLTIFVDADQGTSNVDPPIFKVEPDAVTLSQIPLLPNVPENGEPDVALTIGSATRRFRSVHMQRNFRGFERLSTGTTRLTGSNSLSFVAPSSEGEVFQLASDLPVSDNGFEKMIINVGSNYGMLRITDADDSNVLKTYLLPAGDEASVQSTALIWYDGQWHVQSRDIINNQDVYIKSLILRDSETERTMLQTLSNAVWIKRDLLLGGEQFLPVSSNVWHVTQTSNHSLTLHGGYVDTSNNTMDFPYDLADILSVQSSNVYIPSLVTGTLAASNLYYDTQVNLATWSGHAQPHAIRTRHHPVVTASNALDIMVWSASQSEQELQVTVQGDTGFVGLGIENPTHGLHLHDKPHIHLTNTITGASSEDGIVLVLKDESRDAALINQELEEGSLVFGTSNTERLRIHHDGRLQLHHATQDAVFLQLTNAFTSSNLQRGFEIGYGNQLVAGALALGTADTIRSDSNVVRLWNYESVGEIHFGTSNATRMQIASDGDVYMAGALHVGGGFIRENVMHEELSFTDVGPVSFGQPFSTASNASLTPAYVKLLTLPLADYHAFEVDAYFFGPQQQMRIRLTGMGQDKNTSTTVLKPYFASEITQANPFPATPQPNLVVRKSTAAPTFMTVWAVLPASTSPNGVFYCKSTYKEGIELRLQSTNPDNGTDLHNALTNFATKYVADTRSLYIGGSMFAQNKYFKIPHPVPEKANRGEMLEHATVETPSKLGDNMYRYTITSTTEHEEARIQLPDYWAFLNVDAQVWLCPVKGYGRAWGEVRVDEVSKTAHIHACMELPGTYNVLVLASRRV